MIYGNKHDYVKIDIFIYNNKTGIFDYYCTTTRSRTVKDAKKRFLVTHPEYTENNILCKRGVK
jgi:hypothetical protein